MRNNTLYSYLVYFVENQQRTGSKLRGIRGDIVKRDDKNYICLGLPAAIFKPTLEGVTGKKLAISENHVTVYNNEDTSNPHTSQYHYTATFSSQGKVKKRYRLHVFFDRQGEITTAPEFKEFIDHEGNLGPLIKLDEISKVAFIQLAQNSSQSLLADLYKKQSQTMKAFIAKYEEENERCQALSLDLQGNFVEYLTHLDQCIETAQILASMEQQPYYQGKYTFLRSLKGHVIEAHEQQAKQASREEIEAIGDVLPQQPAEVYAEKLTAPMSQSAALSKSDETSRIDELSAAWTVLNQKALDAEYPVDLSQFLSTLNEQSLIFQDNPNTDPLVLNRMFQLINTVETRIKAVLAHYLSTPNVIARDDVGEQLSHHIEWANQFSAIQHLLTEDQVYAAIEKNQPEALEYLLTQGQFDINEMTIQSNDQGVMSLASYCFSQSSAAKPLLPCLRVLIEHNANLFEVQASGLPLAYSIYSSNDDELMEALEIQHVRKPEFYKRLIAVLTLYLETHPEDPEQKNIRANLIKIQASVDGFAQDVKRLGTPAAAEAYQLTEIRIRAEASRLNQAFFKSDNHRRVRSDPEVVAALEKRGKTETELASVQKEYFDVMNPLKSKYTQKASAAKEVSELAQTKNIVYSSYFRGLSFLQLKAFTLKHLQAGQNVLELEIAYGRACINLHLLRQVTHMPKKIRQQEEAMLIRSLQELEKTRTELQEILALYEAKKYADPGKESLETKPVSQAKNPNALFSAAAEASVLVTSSASSLAPKNV
ncbi:MAG: hypothetical protein A3F46_08840 [Legionellales bacterium RIFCSPHIGHO2_12_FULL_42_9]|nr:MAG: hypothetical protein A3F46_08840 [Legionellales bacterium RIFCSPHIGHO2_12_FULL_42_9]